MKKIGFIILAALSLSACDLPAISKAKSAVAESLKDPASAQFRNVNYYANEAGENLVCGEVNGKNSYGGYVGFRRFVVGADGHGLIIEPEDVRVVSGSTPELVAATAHLRFDSDFSKRCRQYRPS